MACPNGLFRQPNVAWGRINYFGETTGIGTLYYLGLLWAINLVGMLLWRLPACISRCIDVSLFPQILLKINELQLWILEDPNIWVECLHEWAQMFWRAMPYGYEEFVHCSTSWYITLCMHLLWCLLTSVAEIMVWRLYLSPTRGTYDIGCQSGAHYLTGEGGVAEKICYYWKARIAKNVVNIPKIVPRVIDPLRVQFIMNKLSC